MGNDWGLCSPIFAGLPRDIGPQQTVPLFCWTEMAPAAKKIDNLSLQNMIFNEISWYSMLPYPQNFQQQAPTYLPPPPLHFSLIPTPPLMQLTNIVCFLNCIDLATPTPPINTVPSTDVKYPTYLCFGSRMVSPWLHESLDWPSTQSLSPIVTESPVMLKSITVWCFSST